jgi:hypothetical protein
MLPSDAEELFMTKAQYEVFEALNPFFGTANWFMELTEKLNKNRFKVKGT